MIIARLLSDNSLYRSAAFLVMLASCIGFFIFSINNPVENWDILGYAGSVASLWETDAVALHRGVYVEFEAYASSAAFQELTQSTSYRQAMFEDPAAFVQQIPYYKIRVAFIMLVALLGKFGVNAYEAQHLLSAGFGCAGLFLLFLGLRHHIHSLLWISVPLFFYHFTHDLLVVQTGAVDSFGFFWVVLTLLAFVHRSPLLLPLLALSVLVRTDLILYVGLMFALVFFTDYTKWKVIGLWGVVCAGLYLWVNHWAGNYGWQTVFYFVFMTDMEATHPSEYSQFGVSLQQYWQVLIRPQWVSKWLWFTLLGLIIACGMYLYRLRKGEGGALVGQYIALGLVAIAYVAVHYILFPVIFMRFFVAQYLVMLLAFMVAATCWWQHFIADESRMSDR